MSTNYYWIKNRCVCCNRTEDRIHIGKKSAGWEFNFQSLDKHEHGGARSWKEWKAILETAPEIEDEYGRPVELRDFVDTVESEKDYYGKPLQNHYDYCLGRCDMSHDWKDEEGYSFTDSDFS